MEAKSSCTDYFFSLPLDILVDLLRTTDRSTIVNFASACKHHKNQFDKEDGLWKRLTLKIFGWTALGNYKKIIIIYRGVFWVK
jgi:hypothetical protein